MANSGIDAPKRNFFGDRHEAFDRGWLAAKREQLVFAAEGGSHLIHDSAGCADDVVLGQLAQSRQLLARQVDFEGGGDAAHRCDFNGGRGTDALPFRNT